MLNPFCTVFTVKCSVDIIFTLILFGKNKKPKIKNNLLTVGSVFLFSLPSWFLLVRRYPTAYHIRRLSGKTIIPVKNHHSVKINLLNRNKYFTLKNIVLLIIIIQCVHKHVDGLRIKSTMTSTWTTFHYLYLVFCHLLNHLQYRGIRWSHYFL